MYIPNTLNSIWNLESYKNEFSHLFPFSPRLSSFLPWNPDTCHSFWLGPYFHRELTLTIEISVHTSLLYRSLPWSPHLNYIHPFFLPLCLIFLLHFLHHTSTFSKLSFIFVCLLLSVFSHRVKPLYENRNLIYPTTVPKMLQCLQDQ